MSAWKTSIGLLFIASAITPLRAQNLSVTDKAPTPNTFWLQGGIGLGGLRYEQPAAIYNYRRWNQPKELSAEWQHWRGVGVGVYGGWHSETYVYRTYLLYAPTSAGYPYMLEDKGQVTITQQYRSGGLRATFHLTELLRETAPFRRINPRVFDLYTALQAGLTHVASTKPVTLDGQPAQYDPVFTGYNTGEDMRWQLGIVGGLRVMPFRFAGLYFEGGLGPLSPAQVGVVVRVP